MNFDMVWEGIGDGSLTGDSPWRQVCLWLPSLCGLSLSSITTACLPVHTAFCVVGAEQCGWAVWCEHGMMSDCGHVRQHECDHAARASMYVCELGMYDKVPITSHKDGSCHLSFHQAAKCTMAAGLHAFWPVLQCKISAYRSRPGKWIHKLSHGQIESFRGLECHSRSCMSGNWSCWQGWGGVFRSWLMHTLHQAINPLNVCQISHTYKAYGLLKVLCYCIV